MMLPQCEQMLSWRQRVASEQAELLDKLQRLENFMKSPMFFEISKTQQTLITAQFGYMSGYNSILSCRLRGE